MIWLQRKTLFLFFYLMFAFVLVSESAEWSVESGINAKEEVNDNLQMTAASHQTVWVSMISPAGKMALKEENIGLNGSISAVMNHYAGEEELDTTDQFYTLSARFDRTERERWTLQGTYQIDSTLGSELTSTGVVLQRTQRNNGSASIGWRKRFMEDTDFEGNYQWVNVGYVDPSTGLYNYHVDSGMAGMTHQLTENNQINGDLSYSVYRIPGQNYHSWDGGIRAGTVYSFSERLKWTFSAGYHQTGSSFKPPGMEIQHLDSGWVLKGDLEGQTERTILHGGYSREVQMSGGGSLVQVDHFFTEMNKKLTDRTNLSLGADFYMTLPFREELTFLKSNYGQVRGEWSWEWTEHWEIRAGYSYSAQKNEALSQTISSNVAYFKMAYSTPKWSLSR